MRGECGSGGAVAGSYRPPAWGWAATIRGWWARCRGEERLAPLGASGASLAPVWGRRAFQQQGVPYFQYIAIYICMHVNGIHIHMLLTVGRLLEFKGLNWIKSEL